MSKNEPAYKLGDVIYRSNPWIYSVLESAANSVCYMCLRKPSSSQEQLRRCTQCAFAHYCSPVCQKEDWLNRHKSECKLLAKALADPNGAGRGTLSFDYLLIMFKIIIKLTRGEIGDDKSVCASTSERTFNDLMSHQEELYPNPAVMQLYAHMRPYIAVLDKAGRICPDYSSFVRIYGRFHTNAFSIADYFVGDVAKGLYLGPSVLDHSCDNNAVQMFDGKTLIIKAVTDIASLSDVRIAYDSTFNIRQVRQSLLRQQYFFTCSCRYCTDPQLEAERYAVKCLNPTCLEAIPFVSGPPGNNYVCPSCRSNNTSRVCTASTLLSRIVRDQEEAKLPGEEVAEMSSKRRFRLEELLNSGADILHPTNFALGLASLDLFGLLVEEGKNDESVACLKRALPALEKHGKRYESAMTGALSELSHDCMDRRQFAEAIGYLKNLLEQLAVVPGQNTPVYLEYAKHLEYCEGVTRIAD